MCVSGCLLWGLKENGDGSGRGEQAPTRLSWGPTATSAFHLRGKTGRFGTGREGGRGSGRGGVSSALTASSSPDGVMTVTSEGRPDGSPPACRALRFIVNTPAPSSPGRREKVDVELGSSCSCHAASASLSLAISFTKGCGVCSQQLSEQWTFRPFHQRGGGGVRTPLDQAADGWLSPGCGVARRVGKPTRRVFYSPLDATVSTLPPMATSSFHVSSSGVVQKPKVISQVTVSRLRLPIH